ncbi:MAG: hypothetical protein K6A61_06260 [Butyrivibrio sp.]|nr:hypothetical protein [Butyrivibrio sp.]
MKSSPEADKDTSFLLTKIIRNKKIKKAIFRAIRKVKGVSLPASMTVEASLVLPLFIFFFANLMVMFNVIKVQSDIEAALHQVGNEIALRAFDVSFAENAAGIGSDANAIKGVVSVSYASSKVREYLGTGIDRSCVAGGLNGLGYMRSDVTNGGDIVDIVVDYKVKPLIPVAGFTKFPVEGRYYAHAWTGYKIAGAAGGGDPEEEIVYVTEHGEVYHRNISCKHLKVSVRSTSLQGIDKLRNNDGSKYYPCEYCAGKIAAGDVFITDYGNRYHGKVDCAGLKRKIYTILISEVGARRPCSDCG